MLSGRPERNAIGVTPYSEVIVCGVSTICYFAANMILCEQESWSSGMSTEEPTTHNWFQLPPCCFLSSKSSW